MHTNSRSITKILLIIMAVLMLGQILLSSIWFFLNIDVVPSFGDTTEYLELSNTLITDEYRTIAYPMLLHYILRLANILTIPYTYILYVFQLSLGILSCYFLTSSLYDLTDLSTNRKTGYCIFVSLFLSNIPIVLFLHCSVLTDSLALSMLIFNITSLANISRRKNLKLNIMIFVFSFLLEILLRADRVYNMTAMIIIFILICSFKASRKNMYTLLICCILGIVLSLTAFTGINKKYQSPGMNGRIKTTLGFVLLDRIVWPHMEDNYDYFSDDVKQIISKADAKTFDEHNNNTMYITAPLIINQVGAQEAEHIYKEMAITVLKHDSLSVIGYTLRDFCNFFVLPISTFVSYTETLFAGTSHTNFEWNLTCVSNVYPKYSQFIYMYHALFSLLLFVPFTCILYIKHRKSFNNNYWNYICPLFLSLLIVSLWFALGDGAPANNRYVLHGYIFYNIIAILLFIYDYKRKQVSTNE